MHTYICTYKHNLPSPFIILICIHLRDGYSVLDNQSKALFPKGVDSPPFLGLHLWMGLCEISIIYDGVSVGVVIFQLLLGQGVC